MRAGLRQSGAVAAFELKRTLESPAAWLLFAAIQGALGWLFLDYLHRYEQVSARLLTLPEAPGATASVATPLLSSAALAMMILVPLLAARSAPDASGASRLVDALPVPSWSLVAGRFTANALLLGLVLVGALALAIGLCAGTAVDAGLLAASALTLAGLALSLAALATACGALAGLGAGAAPAVTAAAVSAGVLLLSWVLGSAARIDGLDALAWLSPATHLASGLRGVLDSRDAAWAVASTLGALGLGWLCVARRRAARVRSRTAAALVALCLVALVAGAGFGASQAVLRADWTYGARNTLSTQSIELLRQLASATPAALRVQAFVSDGATTRSLVRHLVTRYEHYGADVTLEYTPLADASARELGIRADGDLVLWMADRRVNVRRLTEADFSSGLRKLLKPDALRLGWLSGNGERDMLGDRSFDLSRLGARLTARGYALSAVAPAAGAGVPSNIDVLVLSEGDAQPPAHVVNAVRTYVAKGGSLLWLADPGARLASSPLAADLGVALASGTLVDTGSGRASPFISVEDFATHDSLGDSPGPLVLGYAAGLTGASPDGWRASGLATTSLDAWSESGPVAASDAPPRFEQSEDEAGPFEVAVAMERGTSQRVLLFGDGDWASNALIGNGGNLDLALALVGWLAHTPAALRLPAAVPQDARFEPSVVARALTGTLPTIVLPGLLFIVGLGRWMVRRRR